MGEGNSGSVGPIIINISDYCTKTAKKYHKPAGGEFFDFNFFSFFVFGTTAETKESERKRKLDTCINKS